MWKKMQNLDVDNGVYIWMYTMLKVDILSLKAYKNE